MIPTVSSLVSDLSVGVIARLIATPKSEGGYDWVNHVVTDVNFPAKTDPSIDGASVDTITDSPEVTLAGLRRDGRRSAAAAELILYGIKNPEAQRAGYIWAFAQVWDLPGGNIVCAPALSVDDEGKRRASVFSIMDRYWAGGHYRILTFPMTPSELAARDAEDAAAAAIEVAD